MDSLFHCIYIFPSAVSISFTNQHLCDKRMRLPLVDGVRYPDASCNTRGHENHLVDFTVTVSGAHSNSFLLVVNDRKLKHYINDVESLSFMGSGILLAHISLYSFTRL